MGGVVFQSSQSCTGLNRQIEDCRGLPALEALLDSARAPFCECGRSRPPLSPTVSALFRAQAGAEPVCRTSALVIPFGPLIRERADGSCPFPPPEWAAGVLVPGRSRAVSGSGAYSYRRPSPFEWLGAAVGQVASAGLCPWPFLPRAKRTVCPQRGLPLPVCPRERYPRPLEHEQHLCLQALPSFWTRVVPGVVWWASRSPPPPTFFVLCLIDWRLYHTGRNPVYVNLFETLALPH